MILAALWDVTAMFCADPISIGSPLEMGHCDENLVRILRGWPLFTEIGIRPMNLRSSIGGAPLVFAHGAMACLMAGLFSGRLAAQSQNNP